MRGTARGGGGGGVSSCVIGKNEPRDKPKNLLGKSPK